MISLLYHKYGGMMSHWQVDLATNEHDNNHDTHIKINYTLLYITAIKGAYL